MSEIVAMPSAREPTVTVSCSSPALAPPRHAPGDHGERPLRLRRSGRRTESVPSTDVRRRVLDLHEFFEPETWIGRPSDLAAGAAPVESGFKNVVCITLYNEPFELLRNSLSALLLSIGSQRLAPAQAATRSCVVIIADGRNRIDPKIMRVFQRGRDHRHRALVFGARRDGPSLAQAHRRGDGRSWSGRRSNGRSRFRDLRERRKSRQAPFPCAVFPMDLPRAAPRALLSARCRHGGRGRRGLESWSPTWTRGPRSPRPRAAS